MRKENQIQNIIREPQWRNPDRINLNSLTDTTENLKQYLESLHFARNYNNNKKCFHKLKTIMFLKRKKITESKNIHLQDTV